MLYKTKENEKKGQRRADIITDWNGLRTKIKNMKKKQQRKRNEKI